MKQELRQSQSDITQLKEQNIRMNDLDEKLLAELEEIESYMDTLKQKVMELEKQ